MRRPFYLVQRAGYWYYRLNKESGVVEKDDQQWRTTGCADRGAAESVVVALIGSSSPAICPVRYQTFRQYSMPFFIWDECPHIRRVVEETGKYTKRYARIRRLLLNKHLLNDPFADKRLTDITRADIFDLRSRLLRENAPATVNKVIGLVKIVFREAVIREELERDPTQYVRRVRRKKHERGVFTVEELGKLFPEHGGGPSQNPRDYTCFYLAVVTGARRGELMVLTRSIGLRAGSRSTHGVISRIRCFFLRDYPYSCLQHGTHCIAQFASVRYVITADVLAGAQMGVRAMRMSAAPSALE